MIIKQRLRLLRRIKYGNFTHHRALELRACVVGGLVGLAGALFQLTSYNPKKMNCTYELNLRNIKILFISQTACSKTTSRN